LCSDESGSSGAAFSIFWIAEKVLPNQANALPGSMRIARPKRFASPADCPEDFNTLESNMRGPGLLNLPDKDRRYEEQRVVKY
jgi:hypothetical protein